jgi:hypothetical protein
VNRARRAKLEQKLFEPPVSEEEILSLRAELADPRRRAEIVTRWQEEARRRYREVTTAAAFR